MTQWVVPPFPRDKVIHTFLPLPQGKISFKNLKRVARELGENLTDEELQVKLINAQGWWSGPS